MQRSKGAATSSAEARRNAVPPNRRAFRPLFRDDAAPHGIPRMSLSIGQVINGKYRIVRLLGEGGMGAVYEIGRAHV